MHKSSCQVMMHLLLRWIHGQRDRARCKNESAYISLINIDAAWVKDSKQRDNWVPSIKGQGVDCFPILARIMFESWGSVKKCYWVLHGRNLQGNTTELIVQASRGVEVRSSFSSSRSFLTISSVLIVGGAGVGSDFAAGLVLLKVESERTMDWKPLEVAP